MKCSDLALGRTGKACSAILVGADYGSDLWPGGIENWNRLTGMRATKSTRKFQGMKTEYVSDEAFADLKQALEEARAFERGERRDLHVTRIRARRPPKKK